MNNFVKYYRGCKIIRQGDYYVAFTEQDLKIDQSKILIQIQIKIDNYINSKFMDIK